MRQIVVDLASALLSAFGMITLGLPFLLNWWIHGSYERYIWIINGPPPYNQFGGGPYQLWMHVQLVILGVVLTGVGILLRWRMWSEFGDRYRGQPIGSHLWLEPSSLVTQTTLENLNEVIFIRSS